MKTTRFILSIDGGGIKGLIPAVFLAELEKRSGKRVKDMFDLVVGTSTGGILTCGVGYSDVYPDKYNMSDVVKMYVEDGPKIFYGCKGRYNNEGKEGLWHDTSRFIRTIRDTFSGYRYGLEPMIEVFKKHFGNIKLKHVKMPIVSTAYDMNSKNLFLMKSYTESANWMALWEAAAATSSAPTFFPPYCVGDKALIDGGVYANNPSMVGYIEAKKYFPKDDFYIVSLGTGEQVKHYECEDATEWSDYEWLSPILDILIDGPNKSYEYQLNVLKKVDNRFRGYLRYNVNTDGVVSTGMDNATPMNLINLQVAGRRMIDTSESSIGNIDSLIEMIVNQHPKSDRSLFV